MADVGVEPREHAHHIVLEVLNHLEAVMLVLNARKHQFGDLLIVLLILEQLDELAGLACPY